MSARIGPSPPPARPTSAPTVVKYAMRPDSAYRKYIALLTCPKASMSPHRTGMDTKCTKSDRFTRPVCRGSSGLVDADHVPGRVAERAVPSAPWLVHRLLHHVGAGGPDLLEGLIQVGDRKADAGERALGHQLGHHVAVLLGTA